MIAKYYESNRSAKDREIMKQSKCEKFIRKMYIRYRGGSKGDQSDHATKVKIGQKIVKLK